MPGYVLPIIDPETNLSLLSFTPPEKKMETAGIIGYERGKNSTEHRSLLSKVGGNYRFRVHGFDVFENHDVLDYREERFVELYRTLMLSSFRGLSIVLRIYIIRALIGLCLCFKLGNLCGTDGMY